MPWKTRAKVWLWPGNAAWHFVRAPKVSASGIRARLEGTGSPTGSVRVAATIKK
ncbi:MAG: DUF1905 domain-containing protein [Proteobacteria bacterium]|nr:DUF1905 domain-containing protein [Pseudomonadota bacterium]